MLVEVLIYVPSIANFRLNWFNDRLAAAHTAALVLRRGAQRHGAGRTRAAILASIGARAVAMKMGQQRRLLAVDDMPPTIHREIDTRDMRWFNAIYGAFWSLGSDESDRMLVIGPAPRGGEFIEVMHRQCAAAEGDAAVLLEHSSLSLIISADHRRRWSISRCIISSCARCAASPPT